MGAFIYLSAALVACGGGGGGNGGGGYTPPTSTPTPPPGTVVLNASSPTTTSLPAASGYSGTVTFPAGTGTVQISTSATNGTGYVLNSKAGRRVNTTSTPNPFGCVGSTPYAATPRRVNVAYPVHPISPGDAFHYTGSLATTYTESAPCPQPTATSSASITLDVAAQAATQPAGATSDLQSTENDAFPTLTSTTYSDQYVSNSGGNFTEYELKQSDPNGNSSDTAFANPQILDKTPGASWSNNPAATITETLSDGTRDTRTVASDGSYTDTETFPNGGTATISVNGAATNSALNGGGTYSVAGANFAYGPPSGSSGTQTMRNGLFYITLYAQTAVSANGSPALSINVPSSVTGNVYLAALQPDGTWQTIAGPVTVSNGVAAFTSSPGQFIIRNGFSETVALFQSVTQPANTIVLTINDGSSSKDRIFPQWFTPPGAGGSLISDTFVNNGSKTVDPNCHVGNGVATGNQVVEAHTQIDPVLGYTETRVTTTYNASGYGAVCVAIADTLDSYINYQDTTTLIDYQTQNGNPNSVDTLTEYLGMQSPSTGQMARTQSVSPLAVARAVEAIQFQRDVQRAQKVRALRETLTGNRGADL